MGVGMGLCASNIEYIGTKKKLHIAVKLLLFRSE